MENNTEKPLKTNNSNRGNQNRGNRRRKPIRLSKIKYEEKIVQIKRVTKVVKGGKKMTFRAIVIIGDNKRKVGVGIGRADDVNLAIDKAILNGKKNLVTVPLTLEDSVPHVIKSSYGACTIMLRPASLGSGVIAGGSVKTVLELAGIKNISAKQFGSNNILNNAKATVLALTALTEKVELGKYQSVRKQYFYEKIMKKFKDVRTVN
jgi:small subunit ribosomal protein S5|uniref:Small ribosomal subunit protein uS5c n=1 Tax=Ochromonas sp. CCMP1393 TaxID=420556 RepID=A0A0D3MKH4_9STRA|nr:30S ribosomal protein S5 [Ochromonas sp. CCMP1393]